MFCSFLCRCMSFGLGKFIRNIRSVCVDTQPVVQKKEEIVSRSVVGNKRSPTKPSLIRGRVKYSVVNSVSLFSSA